MGISENISFYGDPTEQEWKKIQTINEKYNKLITSVSGWHFQVRLRDETRDLFESLCQFQIEPTYTLKDMPNKMSATFKELHGALKDFRKNIKNIGIGLLVLIISSIISIILIPEAKSGIISVSIILSVILVFGAFFYLLKDVNPKKEILIEIYRREKNNGRKTSEIVKDFKKKGLIKINFGEKNKILLEEGLLKNSVYSACYQVLPRSNTVQDIFHVGFAQMAAELTKINKDFIVVLEEVTGLSVGTIVIKKGKLLECWIGNLKCQMKSSSLV